MGPFIDHPRWLTVRQSEKGSKQATNQSRTASGNPQMPRIYDRHRQTSPRWPDMGSAQDKPGLNLPQTGLKRSTTGRRQTQEVKTIRENPHGKRAQSGPKQSKTGSFTALPGSFLALPWFFLPPPSCSTLALPSLPSFLPPSLPPSLPPISLLIKYALGTNHLVFSLKATC